MPRYTKKIASPPVNHMENLSSDVLSNIFIRLLAKQLARMRCICKIWNALLSESNFVKSHLNHSIHNNDEVLLFFKKGLVTFRYSPGPLAALSSRYPHQELADFIKRRPPIDPEHTYPYGNVIGSVNGLICFCYASNNVCFICIWNHSLSASLTLPPYSLSYNASHLSFGHDPKTDDYKVVRLPSLLRKHKMEIITQPQGEVYSMRKGSWELLSQKIPSHIKSFIYQGVYLNGRIHWLCDTDLELKSWTIVTFDLSAMTFDEIPLPDCILYDPQRWKNSLGVFGGNLCVMSCVIDGECEVWVMGGDDKLWVKHDIFSQFSFRINPCGFTSQKEFLFQVYEDCRFALYAPVAAKTKLFKIKVERQFDRYNIISYIDSLVWIAPTSRFKLAA